MKSGESIAADPNSRTGKEKWGNSPKSAENSMKALKRSVPSPSPKSVGSKLEIEFARQLDLAGITYVRELCPIPGRKYRFDFALKNLLVEVQGGIWTVGGHSTGGGITRDAEKAILAQLEGWKVFHITKEHITSGKALTWVMLALHSGR
jgi:hypothetical protein